MGAVRLLGMKLVLLAISFGALAAAIPAPSGSEAESLATASWGGFKLLHLILGTVGAGLALWFVERFDTKTLGMTLTCGIASATAGTPFFSYGWTNFFLSAGEAARAPLPTPVENLLALALGAGGLYLIPAVMGIFRTLRNNPFAVIDWLRGRGGPPSPPSPPSTGGGS